MLLLLLLFGCRFPNVKIGFERRNKQGLKKKERYLMRQYNIIYNFFNKTILSSIR